MNDHAEHRISGRAAGLIVALALATVLWIGAPRALAYGTYMHGGMVTCATCHLDGHTRWKPVNEVCNTCHPGYALPSASAMCWTCHAPGQDMSGVRNDAACIAACHLADGATSTHAAHADRPATCTACHALTASVTDAVGSPHHTRPLPPPPTVAGFLPAAAAVGDLVTLAGTGFVGALSVSFNGTPADVFTLISDTKLTAIVPEGATSGAITVTTSGGAGTSATRLSVIGEVTAKVTLSVRAASLSLGESVLFTGAVRPASLAGGRVRCTVRLRASGAWMTVRVAVVRTAAGGLYRWAYTPPRKGRYGVRAAIAQTSAHTAARSRWVALTVR